MNIIMKYTELKNMLLTQGVKATIEELEEDWFDGYSHRPDGMDMEVYYWNPAGPYIIISEAYEEDEWNEYTLDELVEKYVLFDWDCYEQTSICYWNEELRKKFIGYITYYLGSNADHYIESLSDSEIQSMIPFFNQPIDEQIKDWMMSYGSEYEWAKEELSNYLDASASEAVDERGCPPDGGEEWEVSIFDIGGKIKDIVEELPGLTHDMAEGIEDMLREYLDKFYFRYEKCYYPNGCPEGDYADPEDEVYITTDALFTIKNDNLTITLNNKPTRILGVINK